MNNQRRKEIDKIMAEVEELKSRIESLQVEEQDSLDNMPEGLQNSERGEKSAMAQAALESAQKILKENNHV